MDTTAPKRILVIDDDCDIRALLCESLTHCGYVVCSAKDGEEGIRMIGGEGLSPHLVITDIIMPRQNGLETIAAVRRSHPDIQLMAISGGARTEDKDSLALAQKMGAAAVMRKPFDMAVLEETVEKLLHHPSKNNP